VAAQPDVNTAGAATRPGGPATQPGPSGFDAGPPLPSADAIAAASARAHFRQTPVALFGNVVGMGLVALVFGPVAATWQLLAWFVPVGLLWLVRLAQWLHFGRGEGVPDAQIARQRPLLSVLALAQGAMWGIGVWLFWGVGGAFHKIVMILAIATYSLGSVQVLAHHPKLFLAFVSLVFVPAIVRVGTDPADPDALALSGVICLLFGATVLMGRRYRGALADAEDLRAQTERLAAELRVQAEHAEGARREAEAANRAKTQFFAAASHDLRQPLHAMGLFAEALRQRIRDPEVASLVNSINESVDALEGLFGELLDITRIDTGGVEVHPAPVRLRELFGRLRLHFEPTAFEKGLQLAFRGERHVVHTDPVLVERILRNLVSNAIRYTEDGGVLVACRPRGGMLLLQVWDSGIGIPEANLPHVFDEFYQVHGSRPLQAHQRKGLGLGLAIVKRLAALVGTEIVVRSRVGHGTVFSFLLPVGKAPRPTEPQLPRGSSLPGLTLEGRRIVVVEDEAAVREGLVVLLRGWGAEVDAFDTLAAVQGWAAVQQGAAAPDLAIVDYRLDAGHTGVQAIGALRAVWPGRVLPAIVVSGSSLVGHEEDASTHDFHVLTKPVLPNKLRAMIGFKLGVR
jgi:signal transduction histidine kinase/CheY-like chemotaxis protein